MRKFQLLLKMSSVILLLMMTAFTVFATPGDLDPTFGEGGVVQRPESALKVQDLVVGSDGKMHAISSTVVDDFNTMLMRFQADGTLDTDFGQLGIIWLTDHFYAMALDNNGKIILAGGLEDTIIQRLNPDGSPDTDFGIEGSVTPGFDGTFSINRVWTGTQNEILIGGAFSPDEVLGSEYRLLRYTATGDPDNTFGTAGVAIASFAGVSSYAGDFVVDSDSKILAVVQGADSSCGLTRLLTDGSRDTAFGIDGIVIDDFLESCTSLALTAENKIVVAGSVRPAGSLYDLKHGLIRFNSNGSRDTTFGNNGKVKTDLGSSSTVAEIAIDAAGNILVAGELYYLTAYEHIPRIPPVTAHDFMVLRYQSNGSRDTSFAIDGLITYDTGTISDALHTLTLDTAGKIIVGGTNGFALVLLRLQASGLPRTELLMNPGFEAPDGWKLTNKSGDKRECETEVPLRAVDIIKYAPYTGKCAFRFKVKPGENSQLTQKIAGSSIASGSELTLSAWAKMMDGNTATIKVKIKYQDDTTANLELALEPTEYVYQQFKVAPLNLSQAVKVLKIKIKSGTVSGKLWLDDVSLSVVAPEALLPLP